MTGRDQMLDSLNLANSVRTSIKEVKDGIASGELCPVDVILTTEVPIRAYDVLRSIRGVGDVKAEVALSKLGLTERHALTGERRAKRRPMTEAQRERLADAVRARLGGNWSVA